MAITFRSTNGSVGADLGAPTTNISVTKPSAIAEQDILIAFLYVGNRVAITPPTDWSVAASATNVGSGDQGQVITYWKRATASEAASYQWSWTGDAWAQVVVAAFIGCLTSGSPLDGTPAGTANITAMTAADTPPCTATGITTGYDNSMVIGGFSNQQDEFITSPSGMSRAVASWATALEYVLQASAGSTGDKTWTNVTSDGANYWGAHILALREDSGVTDIPRDPGVGSLQVTGSAGTLAFTMPPGVGALQFVGATPTVTAAVPAQYVYPTSDVSNESWTASVGGDLYACVDEDGTPSDTDYIRSPEAPTGHTAVLQLGSLNTPDAGTVTLRVRAKWVA